MIVHAEPVTAQDVTVIICCYTEQRWDDLLAAVTSVQAQSPGQVVVVVDHAEALQRRLARALTGVDLITNDGPRGLSGARNTGVRVAHGRVIAFLDDDAMAAPDWLNRLAAAYADPDVLGVGGLALPSWPGRRPRWMPPQFDWVVGCSYTGLPSAPAPVRNFIGANMSLRREVFEAVGGFSHELGRVGRYPAGCEETELCIRAARGLPGGRLMHDPRVIVHHRVTPERCTWTYFRRRCYAEGISKAVVSQLAGADAALSSERTYVRRTLLAGLLDGLRDAVRGDLSGLLRAGVITAGLLTTATGYLRASRLGLRAPLSTSARAITTRDAA